MALQQFIEKLRCPECQLGELRCQTTESLRCANCSQSFPVIAGVPVLFPAASLLDRVSPEREHSENKLERNGRIDRGAYHWKEYRFRELLPSPGESKDVLLLGCGDATEVVLLREMGFEEDVHFAAQLDRFDVVPVLQDEWLVARSVSEPRVGVRSE